MATYGRGREEGKGGKWVKHEGSLFILIISSAPACFSCVLFRVNGEIFHLVRWCSDLRVHQNYLEGLLKPKLLGLTLRVSD